MPIIREPNPLPSDLNYVPSGTKPHKVSNQDSWWSLADLPDVKAAKLSALDLCYLNFKTRNPPEINWYLYHKVGCRMTTVDGKNYRFSTADQPGVVHLPIPGPPQPVNDVPPNKRKSIFDGVSGSAGIMLIEPNATYIADPQFTKKIKEALKLLETKAPVAYGNLSKTVGRIRAAAHSGTNVYVTPLTIDIARATFDASITWLASVLAHESTHAAQFLNKLPYAEQAAEQQANAYQLMVLRQIGAPASEITYMLSQDGTHYDLNHDGVYDQRDYDLRDY